MMMRSTLRVALAGVLSIILLHAKADIYEVAGGTAKPVLKTKQPLATCVYASSVVKPGDTIVVKDSDVVLICVGTERGGVFYQISNDRAQNTDLAAKEFSTKK